MPVQAGHQFSLPLAHTDAEALPEPPLVAEIGADEGIFLARLRLRNPASSAMASAKTRSTLPAMRSAWAFGTVS